MMKRRLLTLFVSLAVLAGTARAEIIAKSGVFGGFRIDYFVVLPDGFDPAAEYPAILAFGGGSQNTRITRNVVENHFAEEAERRGYIVVSQAASGGQLFFLRGDVIFPARPLGRKSRIPTNISAEWPRPYFAEHTMLPYPGLESTCDHIKPIGHGSNR
jgi:hypothetical protein